MENAKKILKKDIEKRFSKEENRFQLISRTYSHRFKKFTTLVLDKKTGRIKEVFDIK